MKKYNVLVTGIGAIIGYGIVRSLKCCRYDVNIIGMDVYPDAAGKKWCDTFIQSIWASDERYCDFIGNVIDKYNIDLVCFGLEQEIHRIYDERENFKTDFSKLILNNKKLIELCMDKWRFHEHLVQNNLKSIKSLIAGGYGTASKALGVPFLVKPRDSTSSKGITAIYSKDDYEYWKKKLGTSFMVQEIIGDDEHEYTVGVFGLGDGSFSQSITFLRKLSREGSTAKAETVNIPEIDEEVKRLMSLFRPIGPTNFQFRRHKGDYFLLEINPRFSSSSSLRTAFGYNEPEMCIEYFVEGALPSPALIREGTAVRYIEDIVNFR